MNAADILRGHPAVAHATEEAGSVNVRLRPGYRIREGQLRAFLRRELPKPQLPTSIRLAAAPTSSRFREQICQVWQAELGRRPDDDDRFIESGGDSLAAARFVHTLSGVLDRPLALAEVMLLLVRHNFDALVLDLQRLTESTSAVQAGRADADGAAPSEDRLAPFPLTDQQQAYVLGRDRTFASGELPCHTYLEFDGEQLDLARFRQAWRILFERHDALRIRIDPETLTQRVDPGPVGDVVTVHELGTDVEGELAKLRASLAHRIAPLDGPLIDIVVAIAPGGDQRICIGIDALIADLASSAVLFDELATLYRDPDPSRLEPLTWSFREHVAAEVAATRERRYQIARDYWHRRIETLPAAPELPLAQDPATISRPQFTNRSMSLDARRWSRLRAMAASESITPSVLLATAYADVIGMWARSPRFTLNLPSFNRRPHHREVDRIVGEFASFTLVEVDVARGETFFDRARGLQRQLWEDLAHQEYGGMEVLREFVRRRRQHGRAVMPIVFTGATMLGHDPAVLLDGLFERTFRLSKTPQVWLDLIVEEHANGLLLNWDALEDLFPRGLMRDMSHALLDELQRLADGDRDPVLSAPEADRALFERVAGAVRPVPDEPAHAAFERHARAEPSALAVITNERELTRGELLDESRQLGRRLEQLGAHQGSPVAVRLRRGWRVAVAAYASQYAAAPYLPIDPELPTERAVQLIRRSGAAVMLTDGNAEGREIAAAAGAVAIPVAGPGRGNPDSALHDDEAVVPTARTGPNDLCFLLPTSGTTGQPKLTMIEHRAVVNCIRETTQSFEVGPADRVFALTALHHDMSAFDLFGVLGAGGSMVIPDDGRDPWAWAELVDRYAVTMWNSVPASLEMLLDSDVALAQLRLVFSGGDWVRPGLVRLMRERAPSAKFVSVGGPTETTIWNVWHEVGDIGPDATHIPYGRAIANARYHVLDERGRHRPVGVIGELCCSGLTLARGYLGDEGNAGTTFTHSSDTGERLYRTGDLGRFGPDGDLEFIGRVDHQLKVRGRRIDPSEIEHAISAHPDVVATVVTGLPSRDGLGYRGIAAHVSPSVPDDLERWLATRLAPYLVPSVFVGIERFPLTVNGKVDRSALDLPADPDVTVLPPQGALESVLAAIWSRVLGVPQVGRQDDFFRLGGDSLLATRLIAAVRQTLPGSQPGLRALFHGPSVAAMAAALGDRARLERVAQLQLDVQRMTPDQVARMLKERNAARDEV